MKTLFDKDVCFRAWDYAKEHTDTYCPIWLYNMVLEAYFAGAEALNKETCNTFDGDKACQAAVIYAETSGATASAKWIEEKVVNAFIDGYTWQYNTNLASV